MSSSVSSSVCRRSLCDVCVVGGGLVGAAFAQALQTSRRTRHLSVVLIEPNAASTAAFAVSASPSDAALFPQSSPPSLRTLSLSPRSHSLLSRLGVWRHYPASRLSPFRVMRVWQQAAVGYIEWTADAAGASVLGYSVELDLLLRALYSAMRDEQRDRRRLEGRAEGDDAGQQQQQEEEEDGQQRWPAGVTLLSGVTVSSLSVPASPPAVAAAEADPLLALPTAGSAASASSAHPCLSLSDGRVVCARLLVGCDGQQSVVQRAARLPVIGWDYRQRAVVCNVRIAAGPSLPVGGLLDPYGVSAPTAYQRFLPTGPIALLPCHADFASVIWSTSAQQAEELQRLDAQQLTARINAALTAPPLPAAASSPSLLSHALHAVFPVRPLLPVLFPNPFVPSPPSWLSSPAAAAGPAASSLPAPLPLVSALVSPVVSLPLRYQRALSPAPLSRVLLLGDSAAVIHPLAGQGVNTALLQLEASVSAIGSGAETGQDVGLHQAGAETDEDWQAGRVRAGVDLLQRVFSIGRDDGDGLLAAVRGWGMNAFNALPALKYAAARESMGTTGRQTD